jgi:tetratricopeptide (TPR) repeat protein
MVPAEPQPVATEQKPVAELPLNLPDQAAVTDDFAMAPGVDRTFLDKGFSALAAGDHSEAVNYFRRHQRLEASPGADWEAGIAIAYDKMLPDSPYYNWRAARESYLRLMREQPQGIQAHQQIQFMQTALAIFSDLHERINDLQKESDILTENLEKRDEALRRLRELTLGQKGSTQ